MSDDDDVDMDRPASTPPCVASRDAESQSEVVGPAYYQPTQDSVTGTRELQIDDVVYCQMPKTNREEHGIGLGAEGRVISLQANGVIEVSWEGDASKILMCLRSWIRTEQRLSTYADYTNSEHPVQLAEDDIQVPAEEMASSPSCDAEARIHLAEPPRSLTYNRIWNVNEKSWVDGLMNMARRLSYHAGYTPSMLFQCPNEVLRHDGLILFLFSVIKMIEKWTEDRGIAVHIPHVRRLFTPQMLESFSTVQEQQTPEFIHSTSSGFGRLIKLMQNHFYVNKEFSSQFYCQSSVFVSDSVWAIGTPEDEQFAADQRNCNMPDFRKIRLEKKHEVRYCSTMARDYPGLYSMGTTADRKYHEKGRRMQCSIIQGGVLQNSMKAIDEYLKDFAQNSDAWPALWRSTASSPSCDARTPPTNPHHFAQCSTVEFSLFQCLTDICDKTSKGKKFAKFGPKEMQMVNEFKEYAMQFDYRTFHVKGPGIGTHHQVAQFDDHAHPIWDDWAAAHISLMNPKGSFTLYPKKDGWHQVDGDISGKPLMEYEYDSREMFHVAFTLDDFCKAALDDVDIFDDGREAYAKNMLGPNHPITSEAADSSDAILQINRNKMLDTAKLRRLLEKEARTRKLYPVVSSIQFEDKSYLDVVDEEVRPRSSFPGTPPGPPASTPPCVADGVSSLSGINPPTAFRYNQVVSRVRLRASLLRVHMEI